LYPIVTGEVDGKPRMQLLDWPFFPLINHYPEHPVTRNLDMVQTKFISSIDTVRATNVKKTILLTSSQYARVVGAPVNVSVNELIRNLKPDAFTQAYIPVACLLEGAFTSLYKGRFLPDGVDPAQFREKGERAKIIVIADGDVARNDVNPHTAQPQPLGFDAASNYTFANKDLLLNAIAYMVDDAGLITARSKSVKIRPLDRTRANAGKTKWQVVNLVLPLVLLVSVGLLRSLLRKKKFASFQ
jgi:ABC-2 type transport system permease protein